MLKKMDSPRPITIIVEGEIYKKFRNKIGDMPTSRAIREFMNNVVVADTNILES